jgi:hypothetical protein
MSPKFKLEIYLENDALTGDGAADEVAVLLRGLAQSLELDGFTNAGVETDYGAGCGLWDRNGNHCGFWRAVLTDTDPTRLDCLTESELQTLRTAINLRLCQLHSNGRECDYQEEQESKQLAALDREMNLEIGRRNG